MAEIEIVKKRPIWPWIILGIIILAVLGYMGFDNNDEDEIEEQSYIENKMDKDTDESTVESKISAEDAKYSDYALNSNSQEAINTYSTFLTDSGEMGLAHEYSHGALTRLIASVDAVASDLEVDVTIDLENAYKEADHIMKNPYDVDHANKIKSVAQTLSKVLTNIQSERYPKLNKEAESVNAAANAIEPDTKTLNQKGDVTEFFKRAENLLTKMNKT